MSFADRFELLELLREDLLQEEQVQTFRARERATGRAVEVHLSASPDLLAKLEPLNVIDRGRHEGKFYAVTIPLGLDSVGAWRIKPPEQQPPGDFTRMFELRQAPEPVAAPAAKPVESPASAASQPGEFTRVFKKPATAPSAATAGSAAAGGQGEFTRMFQKPVPAPPIPPSQLKVRSRTRMGLIVTAILIISAIVVFVLVRTLY